MGQPPGRVPTGPGKTHLHGYEEEDEAHAEDAGNQDPGDFADLLATQIDPAQHRRSLEAPPAGWC